MAAAAEEKSRLEGLSRRQRQQEDEQRQKELDLKNSPQLNGSSRHPSRQLQEAEERKHMQCKSDTMMQNRTFKEMAFLTHIIYSIITACRL